MINGMIGIALPAGGVTEERLEMVVCAGFSHVAVAAEDLKTVPTARRLGLEIDHCHLSFGDISNDMWRADTPGERAESQYHQELQEASAMGVDRVVMHLKHGNETEFTEVGIQRHIRLLETAKVCGIHICFENQSSAEHLLRFIKNGEICIHPSAAVCYDFGHAHLDKYDNLLRHPILKGRIKTVHIHTNDKRTDQHRLPLDLVQPWDVMFTELEATGYTGPILLEVFKGSSYDHLTERQFFQIAGEQARTLAASKMGGNV